jgi:glycosyltransferase involved in cell wall biosynthesis
MANGLKVAVITIPIVKAGITPLSNLINIVSNWADTIFVISGNEFVGVIPCIKAVKKKLKITLIYYNYSLDSFSKIIEFSHLQLKDIVIILRIAREVDLFVFFLGGIELILPILTCKVLNKKVMLLLPGSPSSMSKFRENSFWKLLQIIEKIAFFLSNYIVVYSPSIIREWNLEKHKHKVVITHEHFLDFNRFNIRKSLNKRGNLIGFIGRFIGEKGVLDFLLATMYILKREKDVNFIVCGDGELANWMKDFIRHKKLERYVKLRGWVLHENLPLILNELKLLVLPSYTEGLPNVVLEAMACGTPVLATPVGAIPDIIKDGETGFLLKSNNPKHIADKIIELLNKPELLEKVSKNAYNYVRENFSYEKTLQAWQKIIREIEAQK